MHYDLILRRVSENPSIENRGMSTRRIFKRQTNLRIEDRRPTKAGRSLITASIENRHPYRRERESNTSRCTRGAHWKFTAWSFRLCRWFRAYRVCRVTDSEFSKFPRATADQDPPQLSTTPINLETNEPLSTFFSSPPLSLFLNNVATLSRGYRARQIDANKLPGRSSRFDWKNETCGPIDVQYLTLCGLYSISIRI